MSTARTPSHWRIADALKVHTDDPTTTTPAIAYGFPTMDEAVMIWDTGCLRTIQGLSTTYKGWYVIWSLAVDKIDLTNTDINTEWTTRNSRAYIGYWYSKDGLEWIWGGRLLNKSADIRPYEWSGGLVFRDGTDSTVDMFYTSVDTDKNESVPSVSTGQIYADENGVWFDGFIETVEMFAVDGVHYANASEDAYFDFRDPHPFVNPEDGQVYCLFEGNVPGMRGEFSPTDAQAGPLPPGYEIGSGAVYGQAAIGIARLTGDYSKGEFNQWEMLPALITAGFVNDQTERPHVVFRDGKVYIFTISHHSTYTGSLSGPDGVYGFVSDEGLFGKYRPLNSSGLVLGNPSTAPYQTYSHFVDPDGYVQAFIDTIPAVGQDPNSPEVFRIGGTLAPTVHITLEGDRTFIDQVLGYGEIKVQTNIGDAGTWDTRPEGLVPAVCVITTKIIEVHKAQPTTPVANS